jgi:hypothetical protein
MNDTDRFVKTQTGSAELLARTGQLSARVRTMLIMVDGRRSAAELQQSGATLGAPDGFLQTLLDLGLIELAPRVRSAAMQATQQSPAPTTPVTAPASDAERFQAARKFMNDSAVDAAGFRAFFFTLKIERCFNQADLLGLMPDYTRLITKGSGFEAAKILETRLREMLR